MRTPKPWPLPHQPARLAHLLSPTVSEQMVKTRLRSGELLRLRPGVYLAAEHFPEHPADRHVMLARAEALTHVDSVISHESAAVVWELPALGEEWHAFPPALTLPTTSGYRPRGHSARYRTSRLPMRQITRDPAGYPITTPARTAVDLARGRPLPQALVLLDAVARRLCGELVTNPRRGDYANPRLARAVRETLGAAIDGFHAARLRAAAQLADPRRERPIESLSAGHFHLAGLPPPDCQRPLRTAHGTFFADFYWEQWRLVGEADGMVKYEDPAEIAREKVREQVLLDSGYRVVRWLGREIHLHPEVVVARVRRGLGA